MRCLHTVLLIALLAQKKSETCEKIFFEASSPIFSTCNLTCNKSYPGTAVYCTTTVRQVLFWYSLAHTHTHHSEIQLYMPTTFVKDMYPAPVPLSVWYSMHVQCMSCGMSCTVCQVCTLLVLTPLIPSPISGASHPPTTPY